MKQDGATKVHRLTFSKSLAQWLAEEAHRKWGFAIHAQRMRFKLGKKIENGLDDGRGCGAYALVSKESGIVLRASLGLEGAQLLTGDSREIYELWLVKE